ncbi:MAG: hypothetical protein KGJ12_03505 [Gammaproteobacteria bacterium]|nr:hypothetical protein [Gammaproteobacteria bacterium]
MRKKTKQLVITSYQPWKLALAGVFVAIVLVACAAWLFDYGRREAGFDSTAAATERRRLMDRVATLDKANTRLSEQAVLLTRTLQIDRQANADVKRTLNRLQSEIIELREEVAFYRSIVSPSGPRSGLNIQSFKVEYMGRGRLYHYVLVLTRMLKDRAIVRGFVTLEIEGTQRGSPRKLTLSDITTPSMKQISFSFKYFQDLEGNIQLPQGFTAKNVVVHVLTRGKHPVTIEKSYPWPRTAGRR